LPDSPKSATVNYTLGNVATPPDAYVKVHYDTSGKPKGSSPANGTAHSQGSANSGHAFSSGSWGLKQPEKGALINELGAEIIVRNGQWFVENNGYPTITNLKKNDIVFNHEQSKALLERGYVTGSHAKLAYEGNSHAKGTAFSGGSWTFGNTGGGNIGGTNTTSNNLNSASNNLAKAASDTSKAASDTSEAAEKLSEAVSGYTDWVEVLFKRLESQYDLLMSQMERIAHLPDKQQKLYEAMSKNSELLNRTQQAIGTYQSHFDSIVQQSGINPLIVHQIQNGSMDISKYDQDTQKIISELQSYYDKLVDCNKQYDDLLNKQSELAQTALDNIEDYIDMMTGIESSAVDYQEALRELAAAKGESAYSDNMYGSLQESIKNQQDVAGKLQSQIKSYQDEINKLMANGYMAEYSTEWFEAQAALNGFRQEAAEAEKTLIELQDQLRELDLLKLQQVIDELDRTAKRLENNSDLTESKGEQVSEEELQKQIDNANAQIQANYNKRNELLKEQAKYDVGSDKYNEIAKEIEGLDDAIFDAMENIEDLKNKIWEVRWQPFFDGQEALGDLIDQTDDLRGLLNSDAFLDKNGGLTVDGIANLSLISQGMNAAKQQIKNYQEALKKLDEDLKNGNISTSEYKEQQKEFLNQISSSVGVVEDYKDSIVDLYTKMLEQENEVAQKSIDKQKELLDIKKKNADYNKTLRKQARDVNTLKAQISALEGVKLFARLLFNSGKVPTTLSCYNGTGNGKRECGTSL
jgi:chromosome segregation ATPase